MTRDREPAPDTSKPIAKPTHADTGSPKPVQRMNYLRDRGGTPLADPEQGTGLKPQNGGATRSIHLEWGHGTLTGGFDVEFETASAGVGTNDINAIKETTGVQLNGMLLKLEQEVLNGELVLGSWNGISVELEASALSVTTHKEGDDVDVDVDLGVVELKIAGDIGHWLHFENGRKAKLHGVLKVAVGGKLASHLLEHNSARILQHKLGKDALVRSQAVAKAAGDVVELEAQRRRLHALGDNADALAKAELERIEHKLVARRELLHLQRTRLRTVLAELQRAKAAAKRALFSFRTPFSKAVATVMGNRVAKKTAQLLLRCVPLLNAVMIVADLVDVIRFIYKLATSDESDATGDGGEDEGQGTKPTIFNREGDTPTGDGRKSSIPKSWVMESMSESGRRIVDALTSRKTGVDMEPELLVQIDEYAKNLTKEETQFVLDELAIGPKASSPGELIESLTNAIANAKNRGKTVSIDGEDRPDVAHSDEGPVMHPDPSVPVQPGLPAGIPLPRNPAPGPVVTPEPLTPTQQPPAKPAGSARTEAYRLVHDFTAADAAEWFEIDRLGPRFTSTARGWIAANKDRSIADDERVSSVRPNSVAHEDGWHLTILFLLDNGRTLAHEFFVHPAKGAEGFGVVKSGFRFVGIIHAR